MIAKRTKFNDRSAVTIEGDALRCTVLLGGGFIAELFSPRAGLSPLWIPPWKTIDPWRFDLKKHGRLYGKHNESRLLCAITGHNFCLDYFGVPSKDEYRAGMTVHGETGVSRWKVDRIKATRTSATMTISVELPISHLEARRTFIIRKGSPVVDVAVSIRNLARLDHPVTFNEHVTFGPPFVQRGVTLFDIPAKWAHTNPEGEDGNNRLKINAPFEWPHAPGSKKRKINLRIAADEKRSSDFSTQQIIKSKTHGWLTGINPRKGAMVGYVWRRDVCPWIGSWEENHGRSVPPWNGRTLTRGIEFGNTPWAASKRDMVDLGTLRGDRTFGWVPALGELIYQFAAYVLPVDKSWTGVRDVRVAGKALTIQGLKKSHRIDLKLGAAL